MATPEEAMIFGLIRGQGIIGTDSQLLGWFAIDTLISSQPALVASAMGGDTDAQQNILILLGILISP